MAAGFITVETIKTGEELTLPIHADFQAYLKEQQEGIGKAPVFPTLITKKINGRAGLSRQFRGIMVTAKIKEKKAVEAKGDAGRTRFSKGFHSLRHSFASVLANKNVSAEAHRVHPGLRPPEGQVWVDSTSYLFGDLQMGRNTSLQGL
jgi:integrase